MVRKTPEELADDLGVDESHLRRLAHLGKEKNGIPLGDAAKRDRSGSVSVFMLDDAQAAKVDCPADYGGGSGARPERSRSESDADREKSSSSGHTPERKNLLNVSGSESAGGAEESGAEGDSQSTPSATVQHEDGSEEEVEVEAVQNEGQDDVHERSGPPARQNEPGKPAKEEGVIFGLSERQLVATGLASALGIVAVVAYNAGRKQGQLEGRVQEQAKRMLDGERLFKVIRNTAAGRLMLIEKGLLDKGGLLTDDGRKFVRQSWPEEDVRRWMKQSQAGQTALREITE